LNLIELAQRDLNLLVTLAVLLEEGSVTEAGQRLGRSPSAISHALGRLRVFFRDPLFVRVGHQLQPTAAAEALREPIFVILHSIQGLLQEATFYPERSDRHFRIIASDYLQRVLLAPIVRRLRLYAPGVDLQVLPVRPHLDQALAQGAADLALGVSLSAPEQLRCRVLGEDHFVCVAQHSSWTCGDDPAAWAALPHVLVSPGARPGGPVDRVLAHHGFRRRVVVTLPHFLAAVELVATTDLVLTLPRRLAEVLCPPGLLVRPPPLPLDPIQIVALWHHRHHRDPGHRWLREQLWSAAEGTSAR
jgi:DNA-binding transcriptional LysR family regulator